MAEARLDRIVKGAPAPTSKLPALAARDPSPLPPMTDKKGAATSDKYTATTASDPLATLPSSPPQIYLNLLILECSFRAQYLVLRARRRLHTFFLLLLVLWNSLFTYLLFLKPREDGLGIGGSVYWFIEMMEKVALMGGVLTGLLIWGTGQWERGVRWPRRWLHHANRGLRTMNTKIVVVKGKWWREGLGHISFLFPLESLIDRSPGSEWHYVEHSTSHAHPGNRGPSDEESGYIVEEDLAPGGDHIKLLLLPKHFSPEFRENWEEYRTDYWEKENERRALLRQRLKARKRQKAKNHGGWLWWTGLWRIKNPPRPAPPAIITRHSHEAEKHGSQRSSMILSEKDVAKAQRRRSLLRSDSTHSRTSSRSSTPALEGDDRAPSDELGRAPSTRTRRGSSATSGGRKRSTKKESGVGKVSPLTKAENVVGEEDDRASAGGSRPSTPGSEVG